MTDYQAIQIILGSPEETEKYRVWVRANAPAYRDKVRDRDSMSPERLHEEVTRLAAKAYIRDLAERR